MKKFKRLVPLVLLIVSMLIIPLSTKADFGDFSGDSDYGGGWDSDSDWDSDWDSDSSYSGSSGGCESLDAGELMFMIAIIAMIYIFMSVRGKKSDDKTIRNIRSAPAPTPQNELRSIESYYNVDPSFSASEFKEKLSNLYVRFQNDWQAKDITELRPYLTDSYFAQMERQLDNYRTKHQTNRIERIAVLGVELKGWKAESDHDVMVAELKTRIVDYVIDDATGSIVRGSNSKEKFMTYEWTLIRTKGVVTSRSTGTTSQTCPHCGAHIDINHSTVCEYCDSVITTDTFDWVVSNIKGISQRTQ